MRLTKAGVSLPLPRCRLKAYLSKSNKRRRRRDVDVDLAVGAWLRKVRWAGCWVPPSPVLVLSCGRIQH
ncbi:hypothetical protein JMJ78_0006993 [Colletotrichum scovillei]|nr:hypothetical protein JMJ78_0006993 [Colletotrichum scovillei]